MGFKMRGFPFSGSSALKKTKDKDVIKRAHESKHRADLLKQLNPEERKKYNALSGTGKFHISKNTTIEQLRQAISGYEPEYEGGD